MKGLTHPGGFLNGCGDPFNEFILIVPFDM